MGLKKFFVRSSSLPRKLDDPAKMDNKDNDNDTRTSRKEVREGDRRNLRASFAPDVDDKRASSEDECKRDEATNYRTRRPRPESEDDVIKRSNVGPPPRRPLSSLTLGSLASTVDRDVVDLFRPKDVNSKFSFPNAKTSLFIVCSGLYGVLLVVLCVAFLSAEVATNNIPLHYFEGFFTYCYVVAILFLLYVFCFLLHEASCCGSKPPTPGRNTYFQFFRFGSYNVNLNVVDSSYDLRRVSLDSWNLPRDALPDGSPVREKLANLKKPKKYKTSENDYSHGSFFLRVAGIGFGLGTMLYNGLELGAFFEVPWNSGCYQVLRGINPILQMIFTFSQMYFVFMNARLNIHKFKLLARFGLAHVVATDMSVWIRTLFKECTKQIAAHNARTGQGLSEDAMIVAGYNALRRKFGSHSFLVTGPYNALVDALVPTNLDAASDSLATFLNPILKSPIADALRQEPQPIEQTAFDNLVGVMRNTNDEFGLNKGYNGEDRHTGMSMTPVLYEQRRNAFNTIAMNLSCGRTAIVSDITRYTSPYLYPFLIEYSLVAGAVLFAMWAYIGKNPRYWGEEDDHVSVASKKLLNYAKTDCMGASKGLFFGLLTLICGLIGLVLFFVLIDHNNEQVSRLAVYLADSSHCAILIAAILATLLGFIRVQRMKFHGEDQSVLGNVLLLVASLGIFAYSLFNIIAGGLGVHTDPRNLLVLATGAISILQVLLQLLFITDIQRRRVSTSSQNANKPGRQVVTFLLICNLTMFLIYTFEDEKVAKSPAQIDFFGFVAWTIIQRTTMPLCIFFRFHSTIVLAEIWKNTYKAKMYE